LESSRSGRRIFSRGLKGQQGNKCHDRKGTLRKAWSPSDLATKHEGTIALMHQEQKRLEVELACRRVMSGQIAA
jgi:hypothetical protein